MEAPKRRRLCVGQYRIVKRATRLIAREFFENLIEAVPYKIHTILTDNGIPFVKRLKTLKGLSPCEYICKIWTKKPKGFRLDPFLHTVGLNN